jgi:DNA-binding NarL/FixJ family response regulator
VDDHPVVCRGVAVALGQQPDLAPAGAVPDLAQALAACRSDAPDVVLLDLDLCVPTPEAAVAQLRAECPAVRILLLGTDEAGERPRRALEAGADGCIARHAELDELLAALRAVHAGQGWLSPALSEQWRTYRSLPGLCEEELACLRLLAAGRSREEAARLLATDEAHLGKVLRRIQKKLRARNPTHAVLLALRRGLVSLS